MRPFALMLLAAVLGGCASPAPSREAPLTDPTGTASASAASAAAESASPTLEPTVEATEIPGAWELLADAPFARIEMAGAAHDGRIWLAGGLSALGNAVADVEIYDPGTGTWMDGPPLPAPMHHGALVSTGDRLLVIGGYLGDPFTFPQDQVLELSPAGDGWVEAEPLPDPRAAGAAAWDGQRVVYAGGVAADGRVRSTVFALGAAGTWSEIGALQRAREHLGAASDGAGRTWFLGGREISLTTNLALVDVVEADGVTSTTELPTPRGGVGAFWAPGIGACLTGGEAPAKAYRVVECIRPDGQTTTLPDMSEPRHGHATVVIGGTAYALLGGPEPLLTVSATLERLELPALP